MKTISASSEDAAPTLRAWWYSLTLLAAYLGTFQMWMHFPRWLIVVSGLIISAALTFLLVWSARQRYFGNRWDAFWHATVILDLLLESMIIKEHDHRGFYLCALSFAIVVGGYHLRALRMASRHRQEESAQPILGTERGPLTVAE